MGTTTDDSSRWITPDSDPRRGGLGADWSTLHRKPLGRVTQDSLVAGDPIGACVRFGGGELTTVEPKVKSPRRPGWGFVAGAAEVLDDRVSLPPTGVKAGAVRDIRLDAGVADRHSDRVGICPDSSRPRVQHGMRDRSGASRSVVPPGVAREERGGRLGGGDSAAGLAIAVATHPNGDFDRPGPVGGLRGLR